MKELSFERTLFYLRKIEIVVFMGCQNGSACKGTWQINKIPGNHVKVGEENQFHKTVL